MMVGQASILASVGLLLNIVVAKNLTHGTTKILVSQMMIRDRGSENDIKQADN